MIRREMYMKQICAFMDKPVIKVLTGMRRSGKSMLLQMIKDDLGKRHIEPERIIYMNFESLRYEAFKNYRALYDEICRQIGDTSAKVYILLDEIQEVTDWEKAVNSLRVDFDCDIYLTGSNANLLSGELATLLSGRYVEIRVYPLSFAEYLQFTARNPEERHIEKEQQFINFLQYGGLPGIHQLRWQEDIVLQYVTDIYNSVLLKDIISRYKFRDAAMLERIVQYVMDNIGNIFSAKSVTDFLKSQGRKASAETVYNYLRALESAFLLYRVPRFDIKGKRLLETQEKYYVSDLGIRHAVLGYRDNDIAGLLENIVYVSLIQRGYNVYIGKQGTLEVDFIAQKQDERMYIQVCYVLTPENTEREFRPLEQIQDNYEKIVLSMNSLLPINRGGIKQKSIVDFLLGK